MGSAMLSRWREKLPADISEFFVVKSSQDKAPENISPDIIVFAVKPQQLAEILPQYKNYYKNRFGLAPLYISIAAGKTLSFFAEHLGADAKVVRTMPNTPALVGKAVTALCANANVSDSEKKIASALMGAIGTAFWVEEKNMNAVTALAGSGPAYVFLFLEALTKAGINVGLDPDLARTMALEMVHGSIHLAAKSNDSFEILRRNVTSKGGTTEAALNILMRENALEKLLQEAVKAAEKKAETLAQ